MSSVDQVASTDGEHGADWLAEALAARPTETRVAVGGAEVELLLWGEPGRPGLFLLHGAGAHAHWWDGVAPLLARDHRVAAMTMPGNGGSDWRAHYSSADTFAAVQACVAAASLDQAGAPVFVGHSMGGAHLMYGAIHAPDAMRGLVLVDTSFRAPGASPRTGSRRVYGSQQEAIARFRPTPPGPTRTPRMVEHVARHALEPATAADGSMGWSWRADPDYWRKFQRGVEQGPYIDPLRPGTPTVHLIADRSHVAAGMEGLPLPTTLPVVMLPDCGHHVMLDRPLVLVTALRALLSTWPA